MITRSRQSFNQVLTGAQVLAIFVIGLILWWFLSQ